MTRMQFRDFIREIWRTKNSFLSILMIIFLGSGAFSGLRSSGPDMELCADDYFDSHSLMDITVRNTLGIVQADIDAVSSLDYIEKAEGSYTVDAYLRTGNENYVIKVHSLSKDGINRPELTRGELPQGNDECAIERNIMDLFRLKIGDTITVRTDEGLYKNSLKYNEFKITGVVTSPIYMAFERGTSTIGNGIVTGFIIVNEECFDIAAYTEMNVLLVGAAELDCFSPEYKNYVAKSVDNLSEVMKIRAEARTDEIEMIAGQQLDAALAQLEDGKSQISDGESQVKRAENDVTNGKRDLENSKENLDRTIAQYQIELDRGLAQIRNAEAQVAQGKRELQYNIEKNAPLVRQYGNQTVAQIKRDIADGEARLADAARRLEAGKRDLDAAQERINSTTGVIRQRYIEGYNANYPTYRQGLIEYQQGLQQVNQAKSLMQPVFALGYPDSFTISQINNLEISKYQAQIADAERQIAAGKVNYENGKQQLKNEKANAERKIESGANDIKKAEQRIIDGRSDLYSAKSQLSEGEKQYEEGLALLASLQSMESISYVNDRTLNPGYGNFEQDCDRVSALSDVFPLIFFLVAALVALTTMTRMVDVKRTEVGAMRTLGFSGSSIGLAFILYGLMASAVGSVSGFFIGSELLPRIIINAYRALYSLPKIVVGYNWENLMFCSLFGTSLIMVATFWGCFTILRESPARLSQPKSPIAGKRILLERIHFLWKSLKFKSKVMYRNIFRYKKRLILTVIGISGTAALIVTAFGLKDSVDAISGVQFGELNLSDLVIYMSDNSTMQQKIDVVNKLASDQNVEHFAPLYAMTTSVTDGAKVEHAVFFTIPASVEQFENILIMRDRKTKEKISFVEGQCIITEKMSELLNLGVGDSIEFDIDGSTVSLPISGVCENYAGHFIYFSPDTYKQLTNKNINYNLVYMMNFRDTSKVIATATEMNKTDGVAMVFYVSNSLEYYQNSIKGINVAVLVIIYSAACLAFAVIYNLNNITITERLRELATLKVIGYYDLDVSRYLYRENVFLTAIGIMFGQVLGYLLFIYLVRTIETNIVMFGRNLNITSMLYSVLLTLVFATFVNSTTHFRLKKVDMVESLKMPD